MKKVTVLIVNWNGIELLQDCLPTLKNQTYQNFEVIVVDNGSDDGSQAYVRNVFPEALIIQLDRNYGFAKPNNIGFKNASGEYILTLNNDMSLESNFLEEIVKFTEKQPHDVYAVNPKVLYYYKRNFVNTIGVKLLPNAGGMHLGKNSSSEDYNNALDIFGVSAGCAIYKKEVIDQLGCFFDETYFAYLEDVDLAIRANLLGFKCKYYPGAICYHKHSATSNKNPSHKLYLIERNRIRNLLKYCRVLTIFVEPIITLSVFLIALKNRNREEGLSSDQLKVLSNRKELIITLLKARKDALTELFALMKMRKKYRRFC